VVQSTTNLAANLWFTETNFVTSQTAMAWTNSSAGNPQRFYRVVGY